MSKTRKRVLVIDSNFETRNEIKNSLQSETLEAICVSSISEGFELFTKEHFCLIIMDMPLLESESFQFMNIIRQANPIPILVLSSSTDLVDKVAALRAGAHGYLHKPVNMKECLAHAQALLELYAELHPIEHRCYTLAFGMDLIIDPSQRRTWLRGKPLILTRKEFDLLFTLASHVGQVLTREQLYSAVWNENSGYNIDESVKAHIKALRKKLLPAGKEYIKNEWGIGYRFSPEDDEQS